MMLICVDELRALHKARGEEEGWKSALALRVQSGLDFLTRDICLKRSDLLLVAGDPVLWALCARRLCRLKPGGTLCLAMPSLFQGAPLAALHEEEFRESLRLPEPAKPQPWFSQIAAECLESGTSLLVLADPIQLFGVRRGLLAVLDRDGTGPRKDARIARSPFGVDLSTGEGRVKAFSDESARIQSAFKREFMGAFSECIKGFPPGRRYGDLVLTEQVIDLSEASDHLLVDPSVDTGKIRRGNFAVATSETISTALDRWRMDISHFATELKLE